MSKLVALVFEFPDDLYSVSYLDPAFTDKATMVIEGDNLDNLLDGMVQLGHKAQEIKDRHANG